MISYTELDEEWGQVKREPLTRVVLVMRDVAVAVRFRNSIACVVISVSKAALDARDGGEVSGRVVSVAGGVAQCVGLDSLAAGVVVGVVQSPFRRGLGGKGRSRKSSICGDPRSVYLRVKDEELALFDVSFSSSCLACSLKNSTPAPSENSRRSPITRPRPSCVDSVKTRQSSSEYSLESARNMLSAALIIWGASVAIRPIEVGNPSFLIATPEASERTEFISSRHFSSTSTNKDKADSNPFQSSDLLSRSNLMSSARASKMWLALYRRPQVSNTASIRCPELRKPNARRRLRTSRAAFRRPSFTST